METKSFDDILKQLEYDRETVIRFAELQKRLGLTTDNANQLDLIKILPKKENKLKTGLKEAIIKYLDEHDGFYDRTTITHAIAPQFPDDSLEKLLLKVSNALTKDRGIEKPEFCSKKVGEKKRIWSLVKKQKDERIEPE